MNTFFASLSNQFREFFRGLGPTKRMSIIAATLVFFLAGVVMTVMVSGRDYVTLLTNVPSDQVALIAQKLNEKNVPFQLRDEGKTVAVPAELLHSTQMALMAEVGSAKLGTIGLEVFDKQDFSMNSYAQRVNYQRALQGELIRSINTLTSVRQSKVLLALPAKKTFLEDSGQATASVVVELHPGKSLSADQVRGIQFLVASSVEGLNAEKVTVVDDRGKMLTRSGDITTSGTSEILDLKRKIESDLEERIEALLAKVVGQAKVVARVDATLNNKIISAIEESVDPEQTAIRSQQTEEESSEGSRANPTGVPGSRNNIPGAGAEGEAVSFRQGVRKEVKNTAFEVPKTVKNIREMAGNLERISVAVLVDGVQQNITKEDGTIENKWVARSPEEITKYEALVRNAIGFSQQRGDSVKIENIQFIAEDFSEADRLLTSLERRKLLHALLKWALLGFSLALFFFIVVRPFMQWITDSFQDSVEEMLPRTIEELEELQAVDNTLPGMSSALPILEESIDPDKAETELLKDRILAIMERDDEKASSAFGMWLVRKDG
ncbi:MAG: flagellar M-ring protein FliF [Bdellovibrionaceae bacterium]|nr:flagellar M-ring protein FliF [Pseudobdellovibrionaceae bacterium]